MDDQSLVLFERDVCAFLGISLTTLKKLRRHGAFPIPELPALDKRHRYSRRDLDAYVNRETTLKLTGRRTA
jgi:hypothetical protein